MKDLTILLSLSSHRDPSIFFTRCLSFHSKFIKNFVVVFDTEISEKVEIEAKKFKSTHNIVLLESSSNLVADKLQIASPFIETDWVCWLGDDDFILPSYLELIPSNHMIDQRVTVINGVSIFIDETSSDYCNLLYNIRSFFQYKSFEQKGLVGVYSAVIENCLLNYPFWSASVIHGIIRTAVWKDMVQDFGYLWKSYPSRWGDNCTLCYLFASGRTFWIDGLFQVRSRGLRLVDVSSDGQIAKDRLVFSSDFDSSVKGILRQRFYLQPTDERFITEFLIRSSGFYQSSQSSNSLEPSLPSRVSDSARLFFKDAFSPNSLTIKSLEEIKSIVRLSRPEFRAG